MQWFRLHSDLLNDPNVQGLNAVEFKVYINLLCHAAIKDKSGCLGSVDDICFAIRETREVFHQCFIAFHQRNLVTKNVTDNETFHIPQWSKKQYKSDVSTERVRQYRKRSKTVTVTAPDTDTDTKPNGLDANAPKEDVRSILFTEGRQSLQRQTGKREAQCRALIGKFLKATGDDAVKVLAAILQAERDRIAEPVAWLERCMNPPDKSATPHQRQMQAFKELYDEQEPDEQGTKDHQSGSPVQRLSGPGQDGHGEAAGRNLLVGS